MESAIIIAVSCCHGERSTVRCRRYQLLWKGILRNRLTIVIDGLHGTKINWMEFPLVTLYEYTRRPHYWIVHDDDGFWLVPARNGGWDERVPFVGHAVALRPLKDTEGIELGIPAQGEDQP